MCDFFWFWLGPGREAAVVESRSCREKNNERVGANRFEPHATREKNRRFNTFECCEWIAIVFLAHESAMSDQPAHAKQVRRHERHITHMMHRVIRTSVRVRCT